MRHQKLKRQLLNNLKTLTFLLKKPGKKKKKDLSNQIQEQRLKNSLLWLLESIELIFLAEILEVRI